MWEESCFGGEDKTFQVYVSNGALLLGVLAVCAVMPGVEAE